MNTHPIGIFEKEVLTTKKPFSFYLTIFLWGILMFLLIGIIQNRQLDQDSLVTTILIFLLFAISVYITFGRYLATITFYEHRLVVNYIFPWNKKIEFKFNKITEIDFKEFTFIDRLTHGWYRGGKWLYLKNEKSETCQFKYNINSSVNKHLLEELKKRCVSNVVRS